jgi:hypothetical protein
MPNESYKARVFVSYAHADEPEKPAEGEVRWMSFVTGHLSDQQARSFQHSHQRPPPLPRPPKPALEALGRADEAAAVRTKYGLGGGPPA